MAEEREVKFRRFDIFNSLSPSAKALTLQMWAKARENQRVEQAKLAVRLFLQSVLLEANLKDDG